MGVGIKRDKTLKRRDLNADAQDTKGHVNVRSVGVGRVGVCILCTCVSEEGGDGESAGSETLSLLSYHIGGSCRVRDESVSIILSSYTPDHDQDEQVLDASCDDGLC
jgi:hypothetical protein